jgi:hypothetical protein
MYLLRSVLLDCSEPPVHKEPTSPNKDDKEEFLRFLKVAKNYANP